MALTYSKMLPLTTKLPSFDLPNVITGDKFSSNNLSSSNLILTFNYKNLN